MQVTVFPYVVEIVKGSRLVKIHFNEVHGSNSRKFEDINWGKPEEAEMLYYSMVNESRANVTRAQALRITEMVCYQVVQHNPANFS